jgi:hypothetical protein
MGGISAIQNRVEERANPQASQAAGQEIFFKDGDQAFLTPVASGEENDLLLDEVYLYTYRSGNRWINLLKDDAVDASEVPDNIRASHKFAFWAYVHDIMHTEKRFDDWEEVEGPQGKKMFVQHVNDFRVIPLGFGRSNYIWNQLVDVYNDWGSLNKGVVRVKRTGTGMYDTSYTLTATARNTDVPADKLASIPDLIGIKQYYKDRYGQAATTLPSSAGVSLETEEAKMLDDDLFN